MNKYFYYGLKDDFNWSDEQFKVVLSDHLEALDILCFLTNTMFEKKIKDLHYKYYSESLAFKYVYQSLNLNSILNGTRHISEIFNFDTIVWLFTPDNDYENFERELKNPILKKETTILII